uniref:DUF4283 domain-containing protein n=1 Tax=Helianthus annuus TaxID=4232 RepID=A0A251TEE1_HELAN
MPENSSIGGLIPPPIPPKPPIPPDLPLSLSDSSNSLKFSPQLECETQKESTLQPSLECAALKAIHEGTLVASNHEKSVPNHPDLGNNRTDSSTIETSTRLSTEFQASTRVIEDLGIHQGCDDVYSGMCAPPKPISSSPKRGSRSLRKQGTKSGSGDPELDELGANLVAHDAQLQLEADKANGIRRTTRSCSKNNPVQIAGFGAVRKQKKSVKFSPMLSDLRANEFVKTTHHLINRNQQGCSAGDNLDNLTGEHQQDLGFNNSGVAADISVPMQMEKSQEVTTDMDKETAATGTASLQRHLGNNNSMPNATAQRNPQQSLGAATLNSGSSSEEVGNVWKKQSATGLSYADQMRLNNAAGNIRLEYIPPVITPEGKCHVILSNNDLSHAAKVYSMYLYGYFIGTSMDFNVVNRCLKHLWKAYDIVEITKSSTGFFYFKFFSEKGLNEVLENGPWMVNNVPLFVNKWEPGLCLEKIEPKTIHIWVIIHNVPLEFWTDIGLSKIFSGIGRPLLLDKVTQNRVLEQTGKLGYARVLVEAKASSNLPSEVEVEFPSSDNRAARVGVLQVTYQWKPSVCSFCQVFGHSLLACKARPRTEEETSKMAAIGTPTTNIVGDAIKPVNSDEWYTQVTRKKNGMAATNKGKSIINGGVQNKEEVKKGGKGADHSRVQPNKGATDSIKKSNSGFNFQRAVQGTKQGLKPGLKAAQNGLEKQASKSVTKPNNGTPNQFRASTSNSFAALSDLDADVSMSDGQPSTAEVLPKF